MDRANTKINILIADNSANESNRIENIFKNVGYAAHVYWLEDVNHISNILKESWDIVLCAINYRAMPAKKLLSIIRSIKKDIPVIAIQESGNIATSDDKILLTALKLGFSDCIPRAQDERLMYVSLREFANINNIREIGRNSIAMNDISKRNQLLLDSSRDAIAYVLDGMHIYVNLSYAELFGFNNSNDLIGISLIDLINPSEQDKFKGFYKEHNKDSTKDTLSIQGLDQSGNIFPLNMSFTDVDYDGERATQVYIKKNEDSTGIASSICNITGLANREYFSQIFDKKIVSVSKDNTMLLALIRIDKLNEIFIGYGISTCDDFISHIAKIIDDMFDNLDCVLSRFSDDSFAVLIENKTSQELIDFFENVVYEVAQHVVNTDKRSLQSTVSIGLVPIDDAGLSLSDYINRAYRLQAQLINGNGLKIFNPEEELMFEAKRGSIRAILRQAIDNNSWNLTYTPYMAINGDTVEQYEIGLQVFDAKGKEIVDLYKSAESVGMLKEIEQITVVNAIRILTERIQKGIVTRFFIPLLNISSTNTSTWLTEILQSVKPAADSLVFSCKVADALEFLAQMQTLSNTLKSFGIGIMLADFSTKDKFQEISDSLSFSYIKLNSSYIKNISDAEIATMLKEICDTMLAANKNVIISAIETPTDLAAAYSCGASYLTGSFIQQASVRMNYNFSE